MVAQKLKVQNPLPDIADAEVQAVFAAYPEDLRAALLRLRALIFETAAATAGVGPLEETLKWGQPSYLTSKSKSGTTIRIDRVKGKPGRYALYVHCQTNLVAGFRTLYEDDLAFGGNRSIELDVGGRFPREPLRHCIALALTYRRDKNTANKGSVRRY